MIELLGLLGCGEYLAFERLVSEAALAPTLAQRLRVAEIAEGELGHHRLLRDRLVELGADPNEAMTRFLEPLERYHRMTAPSDWLEGLVKAYVGDSIANDFYREIAAVLDEETAAIVLEVCSELGQTRIVVEEVRAAIAADPRIGGPSGPVGSPPAGGDALAGAVRGSRARSASRSSSSATAPGPRWIWSGCSSG